MVIGFYGKETLFETQDISNNVFLFVERNIVEDL